MKRPNKSFITLFSIENVNIKVFIIGEEKGFWDEAELDTLLNENSCQNSKRIGKVIKD